MKDRLWKKFENTGSIRAYLDYKGISIKKEMNCHGETDSNGDCSICDTHR